MIIKERERLLLLFYQEAIKSSYGHDSFTLALEPLFIYLINLFIYFTNERYLLHRSKISPFANFY